MRAQSLPVVWPQTVDSPTVAREQLSLGLQASIDVPKLRLKEETTKGLDAARVDSGSISLGRAGEIVRDQGTGVVEIALAVQRGGSRSSKSRGSSKGTLHLSSLVSAKSIRVSRRWRTMRTGHIPTFKPCIAVSIAARADRLLGKAVANANRVPRLWAGPVYQIPAACARDWYLNET